MFGRKETVTVHSCEGVGESVERIATILGRINLQIGIMIEDQRKLIEFLGITADSPDDVSLGDVADKQGNLYEPGQLGYYQNREPQTTPTIAPPHKLLLMKKLKGNTSKLLGESVVAALDGHGRSLESLADSYRGWTFHELEIVIWELERLGLITHKVSQTSVDGVSAKRRVYKATGKSFDWSNAI